MGAHWFSRDAAIQGALDINLIMVVGAIGLLRESPPGPVDAARFSAAGMEVSLLFVECG